MRYIKPFNENVENFKEELKDFCETSLAYLLDDGYNVSLSIRQDRLFKTLNSPVEYPWKSHFIVSLGLPGKYSSDKFYWNDVKDYYIPFLQLLVRKYELSPYLDDTAHVYVNFKTISGFRYLSLDQVINDKTGLDYPLYNIDIKILDKI